MIKFLTYVFFLFMFFYLMKHVGRLLFPFLMKRFEKKMTNSFPNQASQAEQKRKGEVTIDHKPKSAKKVNKDEGDYIDYEDIKE